MRKKTNKEQIQEWTSNTTFVSCVCYMVYIKHPGDIESQSDPRKNKHGLMDCTACGVR